MVLKLLLLAGVDGTIKNNCSIARDEEGMP
jgi:hypothetical protein